MEPERAEYVNKVSVLVMYFYDYYLEQHYS